MGIIKERKNRGELRDKFSQAASERSSRVHVVPGKDGWSVKKEGATRASAVFSTKEEAIKKAHEIKFVKQVVVHKKDGTIQTNTVK